MRMDVLLHRLGCEKTVWTPRIALFYREIFMTAPKKIALNWCICTFLVLIALEI
jgi:hypothetical protein